MPPLTEKQQAILDFIVEQQARGHSPTLREIADAMGFSCKNGAFAHLRAIEKKGYIALHPRRSRITVLDTGRVLTVWGNFKIGA